MKIPDIRIIIPNR